VRSPATGVEPVVSSAALRAVYQTAAAAVCDAIPPHDVRILGEPGVGKRTLAHWLHHHSPRAAGPLAWARCDVGGGMIEAASFDGREPIVFEKAQEGTALLEHVDALPLPQRVKLTHVARERRVRRLGGWNGTPFAAPLITTAYRDPGELPDVVVTIPPLRERPEDIEPLARHFAWLIGKMAVGKDKAPRLADGVLDVFKRCAWSGNAQQMWRVISRAWAHCDGEIRPEHVDVAALEADRPGGPSGTRSASMPGELTTMTPEEIAERQRIVAALADMKGNLTRVAMMLRRPRRVLVGNMERYGIARPSRPPTTRG
jgi:DNA-binding NtrC family response regulator